MLFSMISREHTEAEMHIVIIGDGKVGHTLTEMLSGEGHDIVIIDRDAKVVENAVNSFDVMGIIGNGASYHVQMEAHVNRADLLIAATSSDELNILSCMVGKKIGARHTIARVRNPEYSKQLIFLKEELGLSMVVNPEMETAHEISRILRFPSAMKIDSFAKGRVDLIEIKVVHGSPIAGKSLRHIQQEYRTKILVCAVQRGEEVFIPNGDTVLLEDDRITLTGAAAEVSAFFKAIGIFKQRSRSVLLVGGGKIAYYLAKELSEFGMQVKIIEQSEKRCFELADMLPRVMVSQGDGSDQDVLDEEGLASYDACVALTDIDEENVVISMYAESQKVRKVVTKVNRLSLNKLLAGAGLESAIAPKLVTANRIVRYVRAMQNSADSSSVETLYKIVGQQAEALEFHVGEKTAYTGITLNDLRLKPGLLIACIVRNSRLIIPGGSDTIEKGDNVIVVTAGQYLSTLRDILADSGPER